MDREGILYFPTFSLPSSDWAFQRLLYWDELVIPAPHRVIAGPDHRMVHDDTRMLEDAGLVRFEATDGHRETIEAVSNEFSSAIAEAPDLQDRHERWELGDEFGVHFGKANAHVLDRLHDLGLARQADEPGIWSVERVTGEQFVARVAVGVSIELGCPAITEKTMNIDMAALEADAAERALVLDRALPAPEALSVKELVEFRQRHHGSLREFRQVTELAIAAIAGASTPEDVQREVDRYSRLVDEAVVEVETYQRPINQAKRVVTNKFVAGAITLGGLIAAALGAGPLGIVATVHGLGAPFIPTPADPSHALVYAAWAQHDLGR
jgi:hypothetical protein